MNTGSRTPLTVLAVLVLIVLVVPALGWGMMGGWGGMMGGWGWGQQPFWVMLLGGLSMLAFWGALIVGVILLVRWLAASTKPASTGRESALDILQRRFAAGELTREEYEQMRRVLEQ